MVVSLKTIRVRYLKVPAKKAKVAGQRVLELQAESILRTHRNENSVTVNKTKAYEDDNSADNGRN